MDIERARWLKHRIRQASLGRFAIGVSVTDQLGEYRVGVLLEHPRYEAVARSIVGIESHEIDFVITGIPCAAVAADSIGVSGSVLKIGASVGHQAGGVGSLGFFARRRSDGAAGIVSCNHVIAMADKGQHGDPVVSPSRLDRGAAIIGKLDGNYPRLGAGKRAVADCAFAVLDDGVPYDAISVEGGSLTPEPVQVTQDLKVTKVGRVTPARPGIVSQIEVDDVWIRYGLIHTSFDEVILIASANGERFSVGGDSGALVYTSRTFQPVGLLFANSQAGGPHNAGWSWVHPVSLVADALQVDLVVD